MLLYAKEDCSYSIFNYFIVSKYILLFYNHLHEILITFWCFMQDFPYIFEWIYTLGFYEKVDFYHFFILLNENDSSV